MVRGIPCNQVSIRNISALQLKKIYNKGFQLYAGKISNSLEDKSPNIEDYQLLQEFKDVFPYEVSGLPPKRDIDFTIDLVQEAVPVSKDPYWMITP